VHLSRHQHRIDGRRPDVIDRGVAHGPRLTPVLRIDLDFRRYCVPFGQVGPVDGTFRCPRSAAPPIFLLRDLEQANPLVGADHCERAVAIFDIFDGGFRAGARAFFARFS